MTHNLGKCEKTKQPYTFQILSAMKTGMFFCSDCRFGQKIPIRQ